MAKGAPHIAEELSSLRAILDAVPMPVFVKDSDGRFLMINEAMSAIMNQEVEDVVGKTDFDFFPADQAEVFVGKDRLVMETGELDENEEFFTDGDGDVRTIVTRKNRVQFSDRKPLLIGCISDITDFRRAEAKIRHHATHDYLTGIANRSLFEDKLKGDLRDDETSKIRSLFLIDLDSFKPVNDQLGHPAGDNVLVQVADRLAKVATRKGFVARLGGDEFALLDYTSRSTEELHSLADELVALIRKPMMFEDRKICVSASIGISTATQSSGDREALLRQADTALYEAKNDGRNCWRQFCEIKSKRMADIA